MPQCVFGQIPTACADDESVENLRCCPTTSVDVCVCVWKRCMPTMENVLN